MIDKDRCSSVGVVNVADAVKVSIAWRCMNEGDVYILDVGEIFYVWNGKLSNRTERIKVCSEWFDAVSVMFAV